MGDSEKTITIKIDMEEGEPLGATPNDKLVITKIQQGTIAEGKLRIGDQVKKVNGQVCKDSNDFFRALRFASPAANSRNRRGALRTTPYHCKKEGKCRIFDPEKEKYQCKKCRMDKCQQLEMDETKFQLERDLLRSKRSEPKLKIVPWRGAQTSASGSGPKYLTLVENHTEKTFIDLKYLLKYEEEILSKRYDYAQNPSFSTLETLSEALSTVREPPTCWNFRRIARSGRHEKLADWETCFTTVATWLTHFDAFQQLPVELKMEMLNAIWHVWAMVDKLAMNVVARKRGLSSERVLMVTYNTYVDFDDVAVDISWFTNHSEEAISFFLEQVDWNMVSFIQPLLDLDPSDVELTFIISQLCFNYAGKRHQGAVLEVAEKLLDLLSNDLHKYYVETLRMERYSARLCRIMTFIRSIERDMLEKQKRVEVGKVLDVWKLQFSHPEVFKDNFC